MSHRDGSPVPMHNMVAQRNPNTGSNFDQNPVTTSDKTPVKTPAASVVASVNKTPINKTPVNKTPVKTPALKQLLVFILWMISAALRGVSFLVTKCFSFVSSVISTVWSNLILPHYIAAGTVLFCLVREISMLWAFLVLSGIVFIPWIYYNMKRLELERLIDVEIGTLKEDTDKIIKIVRDILKANEEKIVSSGFFGPVWKFVCDFFNLWSKTFGTLLENMKGNEKYLKSWKSWNEAFSKLETQYDFIKNHEQYKDARKAIIKKVKSIIEAKNELPKKQGKIDEEWYQYRQRLTFGLY